MARPRAGHGWTIVERNGKRVHYIADAMGKWIPAGCACGWPRCTRCRKPERAEHLIDGLCSTCYYYKTDHGPDHGKWFWQQAHKPLFPYNIGRRVMDELRQACVK